MAGAKTRRGLGQNAVVVALYVSLTLLMTYPLGLRLGTHLLVSGNDFWIYLWNNWWLTKALTQGYSIYFTPYLFYPQGVSLVWHGFTWFNSFLWLPLQALFGGLAAHNVTILLTYVVGAYTAYLLAYEITGSRSAAFVGGVVYAFYPHRFVHRGQLKLLSNQWTPLFSLYLVRLTRCRRLRDGVGAGVALALCGLCAWHQMLLAGMWGAVWLTCSLVGGRRRWDRDLVLALALCGLVCLLLVVPFAAPLLAEWFSSQRAGLGPVTAREVSTDLLDYVLPNPHHSLLRLAGLWELYRRYVHSDGEAAAMGWTTLFLMLWSGVRRRKEAWPWLISALLFAVLALGSVLHVNGRSLPGLPLPYALLKPTLLGTFVRHPQRFNVVLALPVSVLAALGWEALASRLNSRRAGGAVLGVTLLILFEYSVVPVPTVQPPSSAFYRQLAEEEGEFAVVDLPVGYSTHGKYYMFLQTLHGRPIVGGHVSRVPEGALDFIADVPFLVAAQAHPPDGGELGDVSRQLRPLAGAGVRYAIIHKDRLAQDEVESWRRWFGFRPLYEDGTLIAYRTQPTYGRDFSFVGEVGDGIGVVSSTLTSQTVSAGGTVLLEVVWGTRRRPGGDRVGTLVWLSEDGGEADRVGFEPFAGWPTSAWGSDEIVRRVLAVQVDPFLEDGRYRLVVGLTGEPGGVVAGEVDVAGIERSFQKPAMAHEVDALFGDALRLLGYDLAREQGVLQVTLHWQARRRMGVALKFFVHLYDAAGGMLVAQKDVMPRDWAYPTTWWEEGEVVSDEIGLDLSDVPPGRYRLAVGVYDPQTGERLAVQGMEGPASLLVLREVELP